MVKMTFTFDNETVERLRKMAARLGRPQSQVVREAIQQYVLNGGKLSEEDRQRKLKIMDGILARVPTRSKSEVQAEIENIRTSRRTGGRRHRADR
jgi:predicted transcriptional regulator